MKKELQEELFESMLRSAFQEKVNTHEMEDVPPHKFSPEFERKMQRLVRRTERRTWRQTHRKTLQRVAAMFALAVVLGGVLVTKVDAVRVPVHKLIVTLGEKFSAVESVRSEEARPAHKNIEEYLPSYIPEGFSVDWEERKEDQFFVAYMAGDGRGYSINFRASPDRSYVDTEGAAVEQREINGYPGIVIEKVGETSVLWYPEGYECYLSGTISLEELIRILDSIKIS